MVDIRVENVSLTLQKTPILRDISVEFERGAIHGLIGRNGSGKTMLMKCICGFVRPSTGRVIVGDKQIGTDTDFATSTGVIIETPAFIAHYSGYRNLKVLAGLTGKPEREKIRAALQQVGLDPDLKRPVKKYSLGMRQRLGLAQAILDDPDRLILDEPMNGLDTDGVYDMRRYLLDLRAAGKTILLSSHNTEDIAVLCDTVHTMEKGVLLKA